MKKAALAASPKFTQRVTGVTIDEDESGAIRARFAKTSGAPGHSSTVRAKLLMHDEGGALRVTSETDDPTDQRMAQVAEGRDRTCRLDADCGPGKICSFIAGDLFLCTPKPPVKACPKGQIFLKTGDCWTTCARDSDCPEDMCCRSDPNAPQRICMGRC